MTKIKLHLVAFALCVAGVLAFAEDPALDGINSYNSSETLISSAQLTDETVIKFTETEMLVYTSAEDVNNNKPARYVKLSVLSKIKFGAYDADVTSVEPAAKASFSIVGDEMISVSCTDGIRSVKVVSLNGTVIAQQTVDNLPQYVEVNLAAAGKEIAVVVVETSKAVISQKIQINR